MLYRYCINTPGGEVHIGNQLLCDCILALYETHGKSLQSFNGIMDFVMKRCDEADPKINLGLAKFLPRCDGGAVYNDAFSGFVDYSILVSLDEETAEFEYTQAFTGCELVHDTHRLALMNAMLHDIQSKIILGDTLSNVGKEMQGYDVVLTNPPFGTKKGGERATRDDFTYPTSNKQLNFLQHIYRSLKADGKARAAVVLPDNVLFADGDGERIRVDLMDKCNLHTILRLPTGIFYAQGVKTNVLFFTREKTDKDSTKAVWFYDLRTNMPSFGKTNPLKASDFAGFEAAYTAEDRSKVADERWQCFTREKIAQKGNSLDLGLIKDDSVLYSYLCKLLSSCATLCSKSTASASFSAASAALFAGSGKSS